MGEGVGEVWQLVAHESEDREAGQTRDLTGEFHQLVVAQGQDGQRLALANLYRSQDRCIEHKLE